MRRFRRGNVIPKLSKGSSGGRITRKKWSILCVCVYICVRARAKRIRKDVGCPRDCHLRLTGCSRVLRRSLFEKRKKKKKKKRNKSCQSRVIPHERASARKTATAGEWRRRVNRTWNRQNSHNRLTFDRLGLLTCTTHTTRSIPGSSSASHDHEDSWLRSISREKRNYPAVHPRTRSPFTCHPAVHDM